MPVYVACEWTLFGSAEEEKDREGPVGISCILEFLMTDLSFTAFFVVLP